MVRSKQPKRPDPHDPESAFGTKQEAVHLPTPTHRDLDPPGSDKLGLSPEEINQFREKGYVINPGIKFGCDFAVYERGPGIDHAPYLVQVYNKADDISSTAVVLAGRLASSVKKQFILAIPSSKNKIDYLSLDWWRAT